ncbi:MAG: 4-hydroxyphenylpyruvate dioxygenase [Cyanothece sp. SIO1E1]|nr:4-hydroxyphenylpyruvate dioxygenase [Cyanothece sp. SIO1E1]
MDIDHIHFYVDDAVASRDWFIHTLDFQAVSSKVGTDDRTEIVSSGPIYCVLSSAITHESSIARYLKFHPPGVADLAFQVSDLETLLKKAVLAGATLLQAMRIESHHQGYLKWAQIQGWGDLHHTLIERVGMTPLLPGGIELDRADTTLPWLFKPAITDIPQQSAYANTQFIGIDHAVLNVARGNLAQAVNWYEQVLGFQRQQEFSIQTQRSALCSQVIVHPKGTAQLPINEPASTNSQIQEFLDHNRGPGIQHIALRTADIVRAIADLRAQGLAFLRVPQTYYTQLPQRPGFRPEALDWEAIAQQEILVDWRIDRPYALLLQAFTQPIFEQPTFFFELIERQTYQLNSIYQQVEGFGEGNFQALFEAIEREQIKRGGLELPT